MLNVLTPETSKVIFGNIEQLIPISEDLVTAFSALNLSHHESICVGKIFLDVVSFHVKIRVDRHKKHTGDILAYDWWAY